MERLKLNENRRSRTARSEGRLIYKFFGEAPPLFCGRLVLFYFYFVFYFLKKSPTGMIGAEPEAATRIIPKSKMDKMEITEKCQTVSDGCDATGWALQSETESCHLSQPNEPDSKLAVKEKPKSPKIIIRN
ncbi:hypothetical protein BO94DRAFT_182822 [Aspergillus sclerotioniger CBS 115572]|uniref:Uncharacterized protein n=1 Tax=Aspergillus sclerotioniger CBS 115572 TaxID=1450535 RepID=A0A317VY58_9EURO|nr:hypothetical protein BO94DRAFT_182822 [Aspergillus sclerotioniger CBS 115572]PWY78569.1 hypothetical protein BO94DRAFT_182822 [Aspergillus sclerotioniger CBS 115572]